MMRKKAKPFELETFGAQHRWRPTMLKGHWQCWTLRGETSQLNFHSKHATIAPRWFRHAWTTFDTRAHTHTTQQHLNAPRVKRHHTRSETPESAM
jgi:hypothetical protein